MSILTDIQAGIARVNVAADAIKAKLDAQAGGLTAAEADQVQTDVEAVAAKLEAIATQ